MHGPQELTGRGGGGELPIIDDRTGILIEGETFTWGGMQHPVPQGFIFPQKTPCKSMWQKWHLGQEEKINGEWKRIGPLKRLEGTDLVCANMKKNLCKAKAVMLAIEVMGRRLANLSTDIGIDHENYSECFNHGYVELVKEKYGPNAWKKQRKRFTELSYTTMYKRLCRSNTGRKNKRKRNAVANRDEGVRRCVWTCYIAMDSD
mmetsp:Transcript_19469/g.64483  ORF Transcript_19469/g.64483 Transcript_19469/m.64483 type:complete len:204 (+) Transcript_19469:1148-1759(+)